jgi:hypothetical protein
MAALFAGGAASWRLASGRSDERLRYEVSSDAQRRAAGRAVAGAVSSRVAATERDVCIVGVETFAPAVARVLGLRVFDGKAVDPAVLATVSGSAVLAERYSEQVSGAPALPQRMGLVGGKPLSPPLLRCGSGTAFVVSRVPMVGPR